MRHGLGAIVLIVAAVLGLLAGGGQPHSAMANLPATMAAPAGTLPWAVSRADPGTLAAYRAALSHPDVLASVPCLCGCQQSLGHRSNLDCYLAGEAAHGTITYATHGVDCAVCQAITQLALDGARQGLSGPQLKDLVLAHYGAGA